MKRIGTSLCVLLAAMSIASTAVAQGAAPWGEVHPDAEIVTLRLPAGAAAAQAFRIEADLP